MRMMRYEPSFAVIERPNLDLFAALGWPLAARSGPPLTDLVETEDAVEIVSDVPGFGPEEVDVTAHDGWISLRGQRTTDGYHGAFHRRFRLGDGYALDEASASLDNGVLRVRVPKGGVKAAAKRIPIRAGAREAASESERPGLLERARHALTGVVRRYTN